MSLYSHPGYFKQKFQLNAAEEITTDINDLSAAFKSVCDPKKYDELEILRKKAEPNAPNEAHTQAASTKTSMRTKLSARRYALMIEQFGYPREAAMVLAFLKGISTDYDAVSQDWFFTLADIHAYQTMMAEKMSKGKYETDDEFISFFFKSVSGDNHGISEVDLDDAIKIYGLNRSYAESSGKLIQKTMGDGNHDFVTEGKLKAKLATIGKGGKAPKSQEASDYNL